MTTASNNQTQSFGFDYLNQVTFKNQYGNFENCDQMQKSKYLPLPPTMKIINTQNFFSLTSNLKSEQSDEVVDKENVN